MKGKKKMTKQELIEMTGSEEQATFAMEIILKNCKKEFAQMAIKGEVEEINEQIKAFKGDGYIVESNGMEVVNWVHFNDDGMTDEKCFEADGLLYRKNRLIDILAVR